MPARTPNDADQARRDLEAFLRDLANVLGALLRERPEWFGYGHASLFEVWNDDVSPLVTQVIDELRRVEALHTSSGAEGAEPPSPADVNEKLRQHGLTGRQLRVKLDQFDAALAALLEEIDDVDEAERYWKTWLSRLRGSRAADWARSRLERVRNSGRRAVRSRLGRLLRIANHVLESLGDALGFVPGVGAAVAATKEFKESLEVAVEEPDEVKRAPGEPSLKRIGERFAAR